MYELFSNTKHRTMNPNEADYFYIPHSMPFPLYRETFEWLRMNKPHFNASFYTQKANHIMVMPCDHGPSDCAWEHPICYNHSDIVDMATNPSSPFRITLFLTIYGEIGFEREKTNCCNTNCIQRQKDIVVPSPLRDTWGLSSPQSRPAVAQKSIRLFFAGKIGPNPIAVRNLLKSTFNSRKDFILNSDEKHIDNAEYMAKSIYCFDPNGWDGGWNFRTLPSILLGCIPVVVKSIESPFIYAYEEHHDINWNDFAIVLSSKDELFEFQHRLDTEVDPYNVSALLENGKRIVHRFMWDKTAFETLLQILQKRISNPQLFISNTYI